MGREALGRMTSALGGRVKRMSEEDEDVVVNGGGNEYRVIMRWCFGKCHGHSERRGSGRDGA